ncbi:UDP-N-acetylmuramate--L-alanine ligase MurC [Planctomycetes bacterium Pan216]|uniref:UDP-N-acetylmuramate--L-alanine ligase n=1 Tax=Kolteria novifilia TaxID=2527975 RepID=A0A518BAG9_9BACT|nr:UDP-N-acetylmuramate--L-alanine ligase MurC [Planctomycetes bacterium Pan216]
MTRSSLEGPIHFIGVGGAGMAPLALLAHARGFRVQGSDLRSGSVTRQLTGRGIDVSVGHDAAHLAGARTVVYSTAVSSRNPELLAARRVGCRCLSRPRFLDWTMRHHESIAVTGTHGKTTTAAMVGHVLDRLGFDPSVVVGGRSLDGATLARAGSGRWLVAEADESNGSLAIYRPEHVVLTPVGLDHLEHLGSWDRTAELFRSFLEHVSGRTVIAEGVLREITEGQEEAAIRYGFGQNCDVRAVDLRVSAEGSEFVVARRGRRRRCRLAMIGRHNVANALGAIALATALGAEFEDAVDAMDSFGGVERRMQVLFRNASQCLLDDYGHNPAKIAASIAAVREVWPSHRQVVVVEPHRRERMRKMYHDFAGSFVGGDEVFVMPVHKADGEVGDEFPPSRVARDIGRWSGVAAWPFESAAAFAERMSKGARATVILTLGAGRSNRMARELARLLSPSEG